MRLESRSDSIVCIGLNSALHQVLLVEHNHLVNHYTSAMFQPTEQPDELNYAKEELEDFDDLLRKGPEDARLQRATALLSGTLETTKQFAAYIGALLTNISMHLCTKSLQFQTLSFAVHEETNARH